MRIFIINFLVVFLIVIAALLVIVVVAGRAETFEYKVSGTNIDTEERVVGHIMDSKQNGNVNGTIWDRTGIFYVQGQWSGKGMMTLRSQTSIFKVEVVEE